MMTMPPLLLAEIKIASIPAAMKALDQLDVDIRNAPALDALSDLAHLAAGLQRRWQPIKAVADRAGICWINAEVRLGEELAKIPKAKGTRGQFKGSTDGGISGGSIVAPPEDDAPSRAELGIAKKHASRAEKLAAMPAAERKELVDRLVADGKPVSSNAVLAKKRVQNKTEKKHEIAKAAFSCDGPFDCVVIDPPWPMQKIDREERPNQDAFAYPVMIERELADFWRRHITAKLSQDCHVFCWTTQKFLPMALRLLEAWSLKYVLAMVWHKAGGFQPVDLPQYNCEFVIYARKGSPVFTETTDFNCCFSAPRREHSRKPDYFYDVIRRVTGGSRIDVFSREPRDGFAQFGNESDKFSGAA